MNENKPNVHCQVTREMNYARTGGECSAKKMDFVYMEKNE